ncbi:hypothetical protein GA830_12240 [Mesorhizobium sp. NBSH29]|uniref:hypothetical protein n=1 Tax=Mesorhizobium sp. NBSH29 TaxID=2654249 RepID=UPI0018965793|nr:hypothetical protein [Mesorhizobium sp. NBSH29]QPC87427.1 hypothetical protein GA830_12240 [Mesorhizobium sp. NBSH29]
MKMKIGKDIVAEQQAARAELDAIFLPRINEAFGPKAGLYTLKLAAALWVLSGAKVSKPRESPFIPGGTTEAERIVEKSVEWQDAASKLEMLRQAYQLEISRSQHVFMIETVLKKARREVGASDA